MLYKSLRCLLSIAFILSSVCAHTSQDPILDGPVRFAPRAEHSLQGRQLTAARMTSRIRSRDIVDILTYEQRLHYVDGTCRLIHHVDNANN